MWPQIVFINLITGGVQYITSMNISVATTGDAANFAVGPNVLEDGDLLVVTSCLLYNTERALSTGWWPAVGIQGFLPPGVSTGNYLLDGANGLAMHARFWHTGDPTTFTVGSGGGASGGGETLYVIRGVDPERPVGDAVQSDAHAINATGQVLNACYSQRKLSEHIGSVLVCAQVVNGSSNDAAEDFIPPTVDGVRVLAAYEHLDGYPSASRRSISFAMLIGDWCKGSEMMNCTDGDPVNNPDLTLVGCVRSTSGAPAWTSGYGGASPRIGPTYSGTGFYGAEISKTLQAGKTYSFTFEATTSSCAIAWGFEGPSGQSIMAGNNSSGNGMYGPADWYWDISRLAVNATNSGAFTDVFTITYTVPETGTWKCVIRVANATTGIPYNGTPPTAAMSIWLKSVHLSEVPGPDYAYGTNTFKIGNSILDDFINITPVFRRANMSSTTSDGGAVQSAIFNKIGNSPRAQVRPPTCPTAWIGVDDQLNAFTEWPTRVLPGRRAASDADIQALSSPMLRYKHMGNDACGLCYASPTLHSKMWNEDGNRKFYFEVELLDIKEPGTTSNQDLPFNNASTFLYINDTACNPIYHYSSYQGGRPAYERPYSASNNFGKYDYVWADPRGVKYDDGVESASDITKAWCVGDIIGLGLDLTTSPATVNYYRNGALIHALTFGQAADTTNQLCVGMSFGTQSQISYIWTAPRFNERGPFVHRPSGYVAWDYRNADPGADFGTPTVQTYTSGGVWTKPVGVRRVLVVMIGGGGGGGGGHNINNVTHTGGAGGTGGGYAVALYPSASLVPASITVTVGAAGTGGAGGVPGIGPHTGSDGTESSIVDSNGFTESAPGGLGGSGGTTSNYSTRPYGVRAGGRGGGRAGAVVTGSSYGPIAGTPGGGGGGAGGAYISSANSDGADGANGGLNLAAGGTAATLNTIDDPSPVGGVYGFAGGNGATGTDYKGGGAGGGGGNLALNSGPASATVKAGPGGNGGFPGGGGGGGGTTILLSAQHGGDGGNGAAGVVYIFEYY